MLENWAVGSAPDRSADKPRQFVSVQYLRAVAALMVVGIHLQEQLARYGWETGLIDYGSAGVDIFFVISGFVMWHTTTRPVSPLTFYYRRIVRIVPLYWLLTSVMLAVLLVAPALVNSAEFDGAHVLASYLFIAHPHPGQADAVFPLLVPGWTLNYEIFFYLIFGSLLVLGRHARLRSLLYVMLTLSILHFALADRTGVAGFYTNPILLEFAAGAVLGYAVERGATISWSRAWVLIAIGAALIVAHFDVIRIVRDGLGAILIVSAIVLAEARKSAPRHPLALLIGDASYSIYLGHVLVLAALAKAYERIGGFETLAGVLVYVAIVLVAVVVAAITLYRGFEKPSLALLRRRRSAKKVSWAW